MHYTIPTTVLTVVADAEATYELTAAVLSGVRADSAGDDLAATVRAAARAKGTVDLLRCLVTEMERTGDLPRVLGLVGGRLSDDPPSDIHAAYCQGAGAALARVMAATRAVAA